MLRPGRCRTKLSPRENLSPCDAAFCQDSLTTSFVVVPCVRLSWRPTSFFSIRSAFTVIFCECHEYETSTADEGFRQWVTCVQQKHEFIKQRQQQNAKHRDDNTTDDDTVSAEELSQFYKQFLDDNYQLHRNYNRSVTAGCNNNNNNKLLP